jgi:hypothetical protein
LGDSTPMYRASVAADGLRQGEILTNLIRPRLNLASVGDSRVVDFDRQPFTIVLTQDCDLDQDFRIRRQGAINDKILPTLFFCEAFTAEELFGRLDRNRKLWERIPKNKDERYHFLQKVDAARDAENAGLPELGIDFKRYFTLPTDEVYRRIELGEAKRRCVMVSPYLEHLSGRFAYFLSRVALPIDHVSE